jgi:hypothetical protein
MIISLCIHEILLVSRFTVCWQLAFIGAPPDRTMLAGDRAVLKARLKSD